MVHETCVHHPLGLDPTPASRSILGVMGLSLIQRWGISQETWGLTGCLAALAALWYSGLGRLVARTPATRPFHQGFESLEMTSAYQRFRHATLPQSGWILGLAWYGMFLLAYGMRRPFCF